MTASPTRSTAADPSARSMILHFLKHGWPMLLIVLLGVLMAALVLLLTVFDRW